MFSNKPFTKVNWCTFVCKLYILTILDNILLITVYNL